MGLPLKPNQHYPNLLEVFLINTYDAITLSVGQYLSIDYCGHFNHKLHLCVNWLRKCCISQSSLHVVNQIICTKDFIICTSTIQVIQVQHQP